MQNVETLYAQHPIFYSLVAFAILAKMLGSAAHVIIAMLKAAAVFAVGLYVYTVAGYFGVIVYSLIVITLRESVQSSRGKNTWLRWVLVVIILRNLPVGMRRDISDFVTKWFPKFMRVND